MISIEQASTAEQIDNARRLFREYEAWLGLSLCFQNFDEEVSDLPGRYVPPEGRLLLARVEGETAGCIAMRKLDDGVCEMKRLFVRDAFRGRRIGQLLIETLIESARAEGYRTMRLDTYPPRMGKAVELYKTYGFREIPPYYDNPHEGTIFMEITL